MFFCLDQFGVSALEIAMEKRIGLADVTDVPTVTMLLRISAKIGIFFNFWRLEGLRFYLR